MAKRMLIDALHPEETRVVIADDKQIYDFDFVSAAKKQLKGNIYLAKITRVEPSLQAAFVEYGGNKQGFLPFSEIHPDYYQIPVSDRKRLMEEADQEPETKEEAPAPQMGENPVQEDASAPMEESSEAQTAEEMPAMPQGEAAHPAYLVDGNIDVSTSSEIIDEHTEQSDATPHSDMPAEQAAPAEGEAPATGDAPAENTEAKGPTEVETLPNEDEEIQTARRKKNYTRRYKIQEVVRRGQIVLVQVIKEERGNKGVSLTTYLSMPGRYCVLMPNSPKDGGISRKIASAEDRKRLKAISTELRLAKGMSVIIRTAGMDRTRAEIKRDYDYLVKVWNGVREETLKSVAPALIYEESDVIKRAIRDQYTSDIDEIVLQGGQSYEAAKEFMKLLLPSHTPKIKLYDEATPLFYAYDIEDQLLSMHDPIVKLRSGGYIVINPTEALISIDVNSGRATGERNIEETAAKTNLEAALEVARQLRLRDLAGLIVIDFIDMLESRNRRAVEKTLKDALKMDRAKIQLGRISPFGLLEMSRQRLRPSISETNMVQCPHCIGRGYIRSNESMSIQMVRAIEKEASTGNWNGLRVISPQAVALHLLNTKRDVLRSIEQRHNLTIQVLIDTELAISEFNLEKMRRSQSEPRNQERGKGRRDHQRPRPENDEASASIETVSEEAAPATEGTEEELSSDPSRASNDNRRGRGGRRNRRGGRGGRGRDNRDNRDNHNRDRQPMDETATAAPQEQESAEVVDAGASERPEGRPDRPPRQRGGRGGRGRRRWKEGDRAERPHRNEGAPHRAPVPVADASTLPAFATENRMPEPIRPTESEKVAAVHALPPTPRDPNAPAKKGWWQKMIDLDD